MWKKGVSVQLGHRIVPYMANSSRLFWRHQLIELYHCAERVYNWVSVSYHMADSFRLFCRTSSWLSCIIVRSECTIGSVYHTIWPILPDSFGTSSWLSCIIVLANWLARVYLAFAFSYSQRARIIMISYNFTRWTNGSYNMLNYSRMHQILIKDTLLCFDWRATAYYITGVLICFPTKREISNGYGRHGQCGLFSIVFSMWMDVYFIYFQEQTQFFKVYAWLRNLSNSRCPNCICSYYTYSLWLTNCQGEEPL